MATPMATATKNLALEPRDLHKRFVPAASTRVITDPAAL